MLAPTRQLRNALRWAAIGVLIPLLLALTGVQKSPLEAVFGGLHEGYAYNTWAALLAYVGLIFSLSGLVGLRLLRPIILSLVLSVLGYIFYIQYLSLSVGMLSISFGATVGLATLLEILLNRNLLLNPDNRLKIAASLTFVIVIGGYGMAALAGLNLVYVLQPRVWDFVALAFDQTLKLNIYTISPILALAEDNAFFKHFLEFVYEVLPVGFVAIFAMNLRRGDAGRVNLPMVVFVSGFAAWMAYHLVPVAGPGHVFRSEVGAKLLETVQHALPAVAPGVYWRNGVPSMHFGWALAIVWLAYVEHHRRFFIVAVGFAFLTVLATLGLGEHYVVDLVVSVPFMLWLFALLSTRLGTSSLRQRAFWVGVVVYLGWVVVLRWGAPVWQGQTLLAWGWVLATLAACVPLHLKLAKALHQTEPVQHELVAPEESAGMGAARDGNRHLRWVTAMFVLSGMAGLMYEVLFSKILATIFGSTALAAYIVLGTYMGGMALGAWLGGRWATKVRRPLLAYAICEVLIAGFFVVTPLLKAPIMGLYVSLAQGLPPDATALVPLRLALGSLLLLLPTIAMGATLPLLVKDLNQRHQGIGASVGRLYAANTVGAAAGAILAGYVLIPALGLVSGTLVAALANMLVALMAMELNKQPYSQNTLEGPGSLASMQTSGSYSSPLPMTWLPWALLLVGGIVTLALEIVYFHMLATIAGNSTYAFALMLAAFLIGLGVGGEAARRWLQSGRELIGGILAAEWFLAMLVMCGTAIWSGLPDYFAAFAFHQLPPGFGPREVVRAAICVLAMLPPAACIGFIYPLAMEWITR
ncbi:MAG: fused MFS/spermidine synthase, partial [Burkholderiales bacterium]|uniref:fused MFS/spermidine synthase n=1 Tax=Limnobacter sp. TaxID=2003368 RepID=UPI0039BD66F4|nr:fused MFS/spermidine synthase [Burkholderiales bacterium]